MLKSRKRVADCFDPFYYVVDLKNDYQPFHDLFMYFRLCPNKLVGVSEVLPHS
jgi:hypothetical protein